MRTKVLKVQGAWLNAGLGMSEKTFDAKQLALFFLYVIMRGNTKQSVSPGMAIFEKVFMTGMFVVLPEFACLGAIVTVAVDSKTVTDGLHQHTFTDTRNLVDEVFGPGSMPVSISATRWKRGGQRWQASWFETTSASYSRGEDGAAVP